MKVLIIGGGGREHALAWKISQDEKVTKIYVTPGNAGTANLAKCKNVTLLTNHDVLMFAKKNKIDLTVVGPEQYLVNGIVDLFHKNSLNIFGPTKKAAKLEGSKIFAKNFMKKNNVATGSYRCFYNYSPAINYIRSTKHPIVIKADGLAAGKGVSICKTVDESLKAIKDMMVDKIFDKSGSKIIVEEYLEGNEASIICACDGKTITPFVSAKDHKTIKENNCGPMTGGMGVVCPNPLVTPQILEQFKKTILTPTLNGLQKAKIDYCGFLFFGIMITKDGVKNLEYNVRMGDPECQSIIPLMNFSIIDMMLASIKKQLSEFRFDWLDKSIVNVVLVSEGYPLKFTTGYKITVPNDILVFYAGAQKQKSDIVTAGGRVLSVIGSGNTLNEARTHAYNNVDKINFKNMAFRKDIGEFNV